MESRTTGACGTSDGSRKRLNSQAVKNIVINSKYFPPKHTHKKKNLFGSRQRFANSTLDISSFQGARTDSDHHLVQIKYGCKNNNKESMQ